MISSIAARTSTVLGTFSCISIKLNSTSLAPNHVKSPPTIRRPRNTLIIKSIYIYVCVCVCVCASYSSSFTFVVIQHLPDNQDQTITTSTSFWLHQVDSRWEQNHCFRLVSWYPIALAFYACTSAKFLRLPPIAPTDRRHWLG